MMNRFKVVVPSFNSLDYIGKTLHSIEIQTDQAFDVCVIDDGSTIKGQREIIQDFCSRDNWKSLFNDKNRGALYGLVHAIPLLDCQDDDVIVVIDGDDWLAHENVFKKLREVYTEKDVYLTWGQCEVYPGGKTPMNYAQPIPEMVIQQKLFRDIPFVFWHPATFKYFLWRHIQDADLRDVNGEYFMLLKDKATLFPMLEMAGEKIQFISETLYIYNLENPLNDYTNTRPEEFERVNTLIQHKARYSKLRFPNE
jgi:glycosyltransferase involved in cell wall biosynthesis